MGESQRWQPVRRAQANPFCQRICRNILETPDGGRLGGDKPSGCGKLFQGLLRVEDRQLLLAGQRPRHIQGDGERMEGRHERSGQHILLRERMERVPHGCADRSHRYSWVAWIQGDDYDRLRPRRQSVARAERHGEEALLPLRHAWWRIWRMEEDEAGQGECRKDGRPAEQIHLPREHREAANHLLKPR